MASAFLRCPIVQRHMGMARSTLYAQVQNGLFPKPVKLGPRIVGWPESEIQMVSDARLAGYTDEQVKSLVCQLHQERVVAVSQKFKADTGGRK